VTEENAFVAAWAAEPGVSFSDGPLMLGVRGDTYIGGNMV
jgi:hypothetical protein